MKEREREYLRERERKRERKRERERMRERKREKERELMLCFILTNCSSEYFIGEGALIPAL